MKNMDANALSDKDVQRFFDRANTSDSLDAMRGLYRDWAGLYDATIVRFGSYLSPDWIAAEAARRLSDRHVRILDVACGTGLVGAALARHGFDRISGLDLSAEMLEQAIAKGCYTSVFVADAQEPWPFEQGTFDAVVCVGALTVGHMDVAAFRRMVEALAPGGLVLVDVEASTFKAQGYATVLAELRAEFGLAEVSVQESHFYTPGPDEPIHGYHVVARRA